MQAISAIFRKDYIGTLEGLLSEAEDTVEQWKGQYIETENKANRAEKLRDEYERTMRTAIDENDRLLTERATLYFRNAKGQIQPITPMPRKPHTLKHGMTVKDPSAYQAKRIFADAKRAGIEVFKSELIGDEFPYMFFGEDGITGIGVVMPSKHAKDNIYISAHEFRRRIEGEIL